MTHKSEDYKISAVKYNELIKNAIVKSGNDYLFCIPYTPKTDAIEEYFNQVKTYMKRIGMWKITNN